MAIDKELVHPLQGSKYPVVARPYTDDMVVKEKFFTKADVVAMLTEIQLEVEECVDGAEGSPQFEQGVTIARVQVVEIIQQKINELKGNEDQLLLEGE